MITGQLAPGVAGQARIHVEKCHTATAVGSGTVPVLATPVMVQLMEQAAVAALRDLLASGQTTVGVHLDIRHLAATPVGLEVTATAELVEVDGRKLVFRVEARDEIESIGEGIHVRLMVEEERFTRRATAKGVAQ